MPIFRHPRMTSAQLMSRYAVICATLLFGVITISFDHALSVYATYRWFAGPSDAWGIGAIVVAMWHWHRIQMWRHVPETWFKVGIAWAVLIAELSLWATILIGQLTIARPLFPGGTASVATITALAFFNLAFRPQAGEYACRQV